MRRLTALTILCLFMWPASALSMDSLERIMNGNYEPSYPFVRCSGFYQANGEWAGTARLSDDEFAALDNSIRTLIAAAALVRSNSNALDLAGNVETVNTDVRAVADVYLNRYRSNYATTGQAWASDEVWIKDSQSCKNITEIVLSRFDQ